MPLWLARAAIVIFHRQGRRLSRQGRPGTTALRAQAFLGPLQQTKAPQPSWAGLGGKAWGPPPFHRKETEAREVEGCSLGGEAL